MEEIRKEIPLEKTLQVVCFDKELESDKVKKIF